MISDFISAIITLANQTCYFEAGGNSMDSVYDLPMQMAQETYGKIQSHSLTDQLLYAIMAQLAKINTQLESKKS